jgi:hypothetical protein
MRYLINTLKIVSAFLFGQLAWAGDGQLFLIQPTAVERNTYIVSSQIDAIRTGFDAAIKEFKVKHPKTECKPDITVNFGIHTDAALFEEVKRISNLPGPKVIVGLTRTNSARLAAAASLGTDLIGISSASHSDELHGINPNFISVGTAYPAHWKSMAAGLKKLNCTPRNTLGVFAFKDVWSGYYKKSFLQEGYKTVLDVDEFASAPDIASSVKCIFFGLTATASIRPLSKLLTMKWPGTIVGSSDLTFFSGEVRALLADYKKRASRLYATTIWQRNETDESRRWAHKYFGTSTLVEPIHVNNYDATIIALNYLCRHQDVLKFDANRWRQFGTLNTYRSMAPTGNLETDIQFVELPLVEWN